MPASPALNPHGRGGTVLFEVPFTAPAGEFALARLAHVLDVWTHTQSKTRPDPNSPGVVRLDRHSGVFLERGDDDGRWLLQGRTWGDPSPRTVHEWHLLAAQAARQVDPRVALPERLSAAGPTTTDRPLGEAANKHLTGVRRRLVGLPRLP